MTTSRPGWNAVPIEHDALMLRVYLAESRRHDGRPLYRVLAEAMLRAGLRGATLLRGIEGFGAHRRVSSERAVEALPDLPMLIEVVDDEDRIRGFLPVLETLLDDGLVTLERIQRVVYRPGPSA
jgi:uncharacterized protein